LEVIVSKRDENGGMDQSKGWEWEWRDKRRKVVRTECLFSQIFRRGAARESLKLLELEKIQFF